MKEKYSEWEFPQPKWFWDYDRVVAYLEQVEEQKDYLYKQQDELNNRKKELKVILFDRPENIPAKTELEEIDNLQALLHDMFLDCGITERTLNFVLGKLDHNDAFMKWRYDWDENGVCLGLRNLKGEKR